MNELDQKIETALRALPAHYREALKNIDIDSLIGDISKERKMMLDAADSFYTETLLVLLGLEDEVAYEKNLVTEAGVGKDELPMVIQLVRTRIFEPLKREIIRLEANKEAAGLSRESVLSGIENPTPLRSAPVTAPQTTVSSRASLAPTTAPTSALQPSVAPALSQQKPVGLASSFMAAKLSGTFAPGLPPRPIAAPAIKTMPRSPAEAAAAKAVAPIAAKVPVAAASAAKPAAVPVAPVAPETPPATVSAQPSIAAVPKPPVEQTAPAVQMSAPVTSTPKPAPAPALSVPKAPVAPSTPTTGKPGLADAIRSALLNLGATAAMPTPVPKAALQTPASAPVAPKAVPPISTPSVPLGREPLPQPATTPLATPVNPLAGIPPETTKQPSGPRATDPYREPIN